ncbi:CPBP family intramembrane glutamic endopeptidase [Mesorhizobium sp. ZC-5]|uniref:CPBP family intramembrane glutamic endopeptidase n=1 Tax=Mesorhizobium sp. ZC-5 TaxID=2986066 RepID=UPI0021E9848C|nr:CPBP family intramembrane glutamic endopeptidase [Mesorhizobium sp. ZC-5]MCV3241643.1 CPBP family intramembrane metalloprotease [Mesorhizobium sp. ZC-5]
MTEIQADIQVCDDVRQHVRIAPRFIVAKAGEGRNSAWRIAIGFSVITLMVLFITIAAIAAGPLVYQGFCSLAGCAQPTLSYWEASELLYESFLDSWLGFALALSTIGVAWAGTWVALRLVHRRRLSSLMGVTGRLSWHDFASSFAVWFIVGVLSSALFFATDPTGRRGEVELLNWIVALLPFSLLILVQSSAEELVFRGYLQQSLAQRFPNWLVWAVLPTLVFTLLHWDGDAVPWMNAAVLISIAVFSVAMTLLVCATGNLGAAFGAHCANNVVAILFFGGDADFQWAALYVGLPLQDQSWTPADAVLMAIAGIVLTIIPLALSLHPRSPFRLASKKNIATPVF